MNNRRNWTKATPRKRSRVTKDGVPIEEVEQIKFVAWLMEKNVLCSASANGGSRHPFEALKLKRMGVSKGFPDVSIHMARKGYHGLYIELKVQTGGRVSKEQKAWLEWLTEEGYLALVAKGCDEAKKIVESYFGDSIKMLRRRVDSSMDGELPVF